MRKTGILIFGISLCWIGYAHAIENQHYFQWERLSIRPSIELEYLYSDNVYRKESNEIKDNITIISPALVIEWALTQETSANINYRYAYASYSDSDNFREDQQNAGISLAWHTSKGSLLRIGGKVEDTAVQPFSEDDISKDYLEQKGYLDLHLSLSSMFEIRSQYNHTTRRFSENIDQVDDYDRDAAGVDLIYKKFHRLPLLLAYDVTKHRSDDKSTQPIDMTLHRYHLGSRWEASEKLIGELKAGYLCADFEQTDAIDGFSVETDIRYAYSEITSFRIVLKKTVVPSTIAEREIPGYYEYSHGSMRINYDYFEPLHFMIGYTYSQKDFPSTPSEPESRVDDISKIETAFTYDLKKWCTIAMRYENKRYDSNRNGLDYEENRFSIILSFEI